MPPESRSSEGRQKQRRIAALYLPQLACELLEEVGTLQRSSSGQKRGSEAPLGVVFAAPEDGPSTHPVLAAVNDEAHALGLRPGQTIPEAKALVAHLVVKEIHPQAVRSALERIAEIGLGFGGPVALEFPDTVWVDVTGSAGLWGGEQALAEDLAGQVRALGHRLRLAVANGPHLARAFARWGPIGAGGICLVPSARTLEQLETLPLIALPLSAETAEWFARLGILSVGQLRELPPAASMPRLGREARRIRDLCEGRDETPLEPYEPPPVLVEEIHWEEALSGLEPLLFSLRGLVARLSARLEGRGAAAQKLLLELTYDAGVARQERLASPTLTPRLELSFELASPLWREADLERVLRSRLERVRLGAPVVALRLTAPELTLAQVRQLQLARLRTSPEMAAWGALEGASAEDLSVLLAELVSDVGAENVGRLRTVNRHRPEASSLLEPLVALEARPGRGRRSAGGSARGGARRASRLSAQLSLEPLSSGGQLDTVTRLLPQPVPLNAPLRVGELVGLGRRCYSIARIRFVQRLEEVEWWTAEPTSRDYLRVWFAGPEGGLEGLVFVDRITGNRYLQGFWD